MPSRSPALLVLDQGTSATRAALYRDGELVATSRRAVSLVFHGEGRAEQDPRELFDTTVAVLEEASSALKDGEPVALGITNQRSTVVLWEVDTGRPLGPALSWRDVRATAESDALAIAVPALPSRTGLLAMPHYGAPKLAWALTHWPEARAAADAGTLRCGPVSTWLTWKLTRGDCFAVDPTNAQRMLMMDLHALEWDPQLVHAARVPPPALPQILPTDGVFGEAHVAGRRIPVRAMLGDQQAVLIGLTGSTLHDDEVAVQLGTGGFVLKDVGAEAVAAKGLLSGLARAGANAPRRYLVEGSVNAAGSAFDRLRDLGLLGADESVDDLCAAATAPLTVLPAWAGLGAPWWEPRARAAILELDESTSRADIVAGTVRGIAFLVADIVDAMSAANLRAWRIQLSGPLAQLDSIVETVADATGRVVSVRANPEASLEGIATVLAEACGGVAPKLSVAPGGEVRPRHDLSAARARFNTARDTVIELTRAAR